MLLQRQGRLTSNDIRLRGIPVASFARRRFVHFIGLSLLVWPLVALADGPTPLPSAKQLPSDTPAHAPAHAPAGSELTLQDLKQMNAAELDQLFAGGEAVEIPAGFVRGKLLVLCGFRFPRLGIRLGERVWKGKHFDEDGGFINQWAGFRALSSQAYVGESWHDGKPCLILEYPPGTPLFANMRDEVRRIGSCLYLSRVYERCPAPRMLGYIALQPQ